MSSLISSEVPKILPFIIVFLIWFTFLVLLFTTKFLNKIIVEKRDTYVKIYDECQESNAKYVYIVRFEFGLEKKGFDYKKNIITINVLNKSRNVMTTLKITPDLLSKSYYISNNKKILKYLLLRSEPLDGIKYLDINHDCNSGGVLQVKTIELQDIDYLKANIAFIDCKVQNLSKAKLHATQLFPFASKEYRELEPELRNSSKLNFSELLAFLFLSINYIAFSSVFIIPCEDFEVMCDNYKHKFISVFLASLASSVCSMIIFSFTAILYIGFIKYFYSKNHKNFDIIRIVYLAFICIISFIFGGFAAFFGSNGRHFSDEQKNPEIYWCFAVIIGSTIFAVMVIGLTVMAFLLGFCSEFRESDIMMTLAEEESGIMSKNSKSLIKVITSPPKNQPTISSPPKIAPKGSPTSPSTISSTITSTISSTSPPTISSISPPTISSTSTSTIPTKEVIKTSPSKVSPKSTVTNTRSDECIGETYNRQIGTKIKSVSEYKGLPSKDSKSVNTNVKTDNKTGHLEEADNYYDSLMKVKKVKSISQYKGIR